MAHLLGTGTDALKEACGQVNSEVVGQIVCMFLCANGVATCSFGFRIKH